MDEISDDKIDVANKRASYDKYIYIPKKYLLELIPDFGYCTNKERLTKNSEEVKYSRLSTDKIIKYQVPIFEIDYENLVVPFDNIGS